MEQTNNISHNSNVIFCKPNYGQIETKSGPTNLNQDHLAPDLSDYCIYVNLEVQIPKRPICGEVTDSSQTIVLNYTAFKNGTPNLSFQQGTTNTSNGNYFTSYPSELGTFTDVKAETKAASEMFGINSITIDYDNLMVPIVTIQFTDIKGSSLFAQEEHRHSLVVNGARGYIAPDISGSFFKSFFSFPYPRFILTVKGFYGEPVTYELTCQDFRASFESATGNFGATAKFVGQMFSILNDITMGSLFASPLTAFGKQYWADHAQEFVFEGTNTPIPTLIEVLKKMNGIKSSILKAPIPNEVQELQSKKQKLHNINNLLLNYESSLKEYFKVEHYEYSNTDYVFYTHFNNNQDQALPLLSEGKITDNKLQLAYAELKNAITAYNSQELSNINIGIQAADNPFFNSENEDKIQFTCKYCWVVNLGLMFNRIADEEQKIELKKQQLNDTSLTSYSQKFYDALGWVPSVRNIVDLMLAHLDTFLNLVYNFTSQVSTSNDKMAFYRREGGSTTATYAFPSVSKIVTDQEDKSLKKEEKTWIGHYNLDAPEAVLVNSLLDAMSDFNTNIVQIQEDSVKEDKHGVSSNLPYPIAPFDIEGMSDPFGSIDFQDAGDILGKIAIRAISLLAAPNITKENAAVIGTVDAYNFINYIKDNNVKSIYLSTLFGERSKLNAASMAAFLNKTHSTDDTILPWEQNNSKNKGLISSSKSFANGNLVDVSYFNCDDGTFVVPINNISWEDLDSVKSNSQLLINRSNDYLYYSHNNDRFQGVFNIHTSNVKNFDDLAAAMDSMELPVNIKQWYKSNFTFNIDWYEKFYRVRGSSSSDSLQYSAFADGKYEKAIFPTKYNLLSNSYDFIVTNSLGFELAFGKRSMNSASIWQKAVMFLMGYKFFIPNYIRLLYSAWYGYYPYYSLLLIGGMIYFQTSDKQRFNDIIDEYIRVMYGAIDKPLNSTIIKYINMLTPIQKQSLFELFKEWVDKSFQSIDAEYDILFDEQKDTTYAYASKKYNDFYNMYEVSLNVNNDKLKTITSEFFQVTFVINYNLTKSDVHVDNKCKFMDIYMTSFIAKAQELYKHSFSDIQRIPDNANPNNHMEALQVSLYNYLKTIWDKWLSGVPRKDSKTPWDFSVFKQNWHFLDAFYNKLSNDATINIQSFIQKIYDSLGQVHYNFLNFLSQVLVEDKYYIVNVQNFASVVDDESMNNMFTPIPFYKLHPDNFKRVSDIIVMYIGEASTKLDMGGENKGDSFLIGGADDQLPLSIVSKTPNLGHKIPAFDVSYGGQYQNYFTDISVTQEKPQTTEVALNAQFAISDLTANREGGKDVHVVGQDLFTIYSNTSYTCTVKMMGCAWIQPLMCFQLNNIPMFWGTYLIYKVSHEITAGNMVTTFSGQRMASTLTPFVKNNILLSSTNSTGGTLQILNANSYIAPDINNDCPYPYYSPISISMNNNMGPDELDMKIFDYAKNKGEEWAKNWKDATKFPNIEWQKSHTISDLIGVIIKSDAEKQDELGKYLVGTVIYNRWARQGHNLVKVLYDENQFPLNAWERWDSENNTVFVRIAKSIFYETPMMLNGKTTYVKTPVPVWNNGIDTKQYSVGVVLTPELLGQIDHYATAKGYNTNYKNPRNIYNTDNEPLEPIPYDGVIPIWHANKYICHHDSKKTYGHVFVSVCGNKMDNNLSYNAAPNDINTKSNFIINVFNSIKLSIGESAKYLDSQIINQDDGALRITSAANKNLLCTVFDVAVSTYGKHLSKILWIIPDSSDSLSIPDAIIIMPSKNNVNERKIVAMSKMKSTQYDIVKFDLEEGDQINQKFKYVIKKNYRHDLNKFVSECTNFNVSNYSNNNALNKAFNMCFNMDIKSCQEVPSQEFIWDAKNGPSDTIEPVRCADKFNIDGAISFLKENISNTSGQCARSIRLALMTYGNLKLKNWPLSACVYYKHLPFWGFKQIAEGVGPLPINGYSPMKGDISVIASSSPHKYGHIQMYDGEGKWLADKAYNSPWVYNMLGVPYKIFRFG